MRVHIDEASWDYGECEHNEYNIEYKMKLQKINQDSINGIMAEDKLWRRKGEQITQLFKIEPESAEKRAPWDAGTIKTVILIKHLDEILYTR